MKWFGIKMTGWKIYKTIDLNDFRVPIHWKFRPWVIRSREFVNNDIMYNLNQVSQFHKRVYHARDFGGDCDIRGFVFPNFESARKAFETFNEES